MTEVDARIFRCYEDNLCPSCQALLTQTEEIIKEIDERIEINKKFWLKMHDEKKQHSEDIFYGKMTELTELRQKIIGEGK